MIISWIVSLQVVAWLRAISRSLPVSNQTTRRQHRDGRNRARSARLSRSNRSANSRRISRRTITWRDCVATRSPLHSISPKDRSSLLFFLYIEDGKKKRRGKERHRKSRRRYISPIRGEAPCEKNYQILHVGRYARRNHLCKILCKTIKGFRIYGGSNFGFCHWNGWSPLQQCCAISRSLYAPRATPCCCGPGAGDITPVPFPALNFLTVGKLSENLFVEKMSRNAKFETKNPVWGGGELRGPTLKLWALMSLLSEFN